MPRILMAGVAGSIIYFIWGMAAWMVVPLHTPTIKQIPQESLVTMVLKNQDMETGVYVAPAMANPDDFGNPESEFMKNHAQGPIYSIYFQKEGAPPMSAGVLLTGLVIDFLAATLAAALLSCAATGCCRSYASRVGFVSGLGVFVAIVGHLSYWNWMHFPLGYSLAFVADVSIGWTLTGLVIASIIRPQVDGKPKESID